MRTNCGHKQTLRVLPPVVKIMNENVVAGAIVILLSEIGVSAVLTFLNFDEICLNRLSTIRPTNNRKSAETMGTEAVLPSPACGM